MAPPLTIPEILSLIHEETSTNEKKAIVGKYKYNTLFLDVLKGTFDPEVQFKDIIVRKWKPDALPYGMNPSNLHMCFKKIYLFEKNNPRSRKLNDADRERLLTGVLESLHPDDADIFLKMIKKNLKVRGLTYKLVKEVYPKLIKG